MSAERRASECGSMGLRSLELLGMDIFARFGKAKDIAYRVYRLSGEGKDQGDGTGKKLYTRLTVVTLY
jgi:hypothetical protein